MKKQAEQIEARGIVRARKIPRLVNKYAQCLSVRHKTQERRVSPSLRAKNFLRISVTQAFQPSSQIIISENWGKTQVGAAGGATGYRAGAVPRLSTAQVLSPSAPRQVASLSQPCLDTVSGFVPRLSYGSGLRRLTRHTPLPPSLRAEMDWRGAEEGQWRNLRSRSSTRSCDLRWKFTWNSTRGRAAPVRLLFTLEWAGEGQNYQLSTFPSFVKPAEQAFSCRAKPDSCRARRLTRTEGWNIRPRSRR